VGGYALEGLVRAGVRQFKLVDFDYLQLSNINRQILALDTTIGQSKVEAAKERALAINPACRIETCQLFADAKTMPKILLPKTDLLIDAIDSLTPKAQLLTAAYQDGYQIISSMGAALRTNPQMIKTSDLMATKACPLARRLRKLLRRNGIAGGIQAVFSTEPVEFDYTSPTAHDCCDPQANRGRKRRTLGSLPTITGIFGLIIANLAIKNIINKAG
jgi:tRNA A37 threonylcarbamoyladenosine dehydratase